MSTLAIPPGWQHKGDRSCLFTRKTLMSTLTPSDKTSDSSLKSAIAPADGQDNGDGFTSTHLLHVTNQMTGYSHPLLLHVTKQVTGHSCPLLSLQVGKTKKVREEKPKDADDIGMNIKSVVVVVMLMLLMLLAVHCTWVTSNAYSSPSIVLASYGQGG